MSEEIELLRSIDASLKALLAAPKPPATASAREIASDADLDGKYGNPEVRARDPRDWTGEPMLGRKFSECPAEYLDLVAERLDYFAGQSEATGELASNGKPVAGYKRLDAARARGWAKRKREGKHTPEKTPKDWIDDIPADSETGF